MPRFHRVGVGDPIGRGHVAAIEIDAPAYEHNGKHHLGADRQGT